MGYQQPKAPAASGTTVAEIQNSTYTYAADAEASDSYAITLATAPAAYAAGQVFRFKANTANTGASSLNVNALGAKTIKKNHDQDTATGDIEAGSIVTVAYDGTNFQMLSSDANLTASEIANTPAGNIAATDVQTALNELDTEKQAILSEGAFANGDKTKLDGIETGADVTDTTNVTAAGALMDSELADIAAIKAAADAAASDVNTGTSTTMFVTPDAMAGSNLGTKSVQVVAFDFTTDTAVGDGAAYFRVPSALNGMNLVSVAARVITAGTTGTTDVQINNVTQAADMLTTKITIDSTETDSSTAATAAVIDTANDDVATGDLLRIDVDATATTKAKGLIVSMEFRLP